MTIGHDDNGLGSFLQVNGVLKTSMLGNTRWYVCENQILLAQHCLKLLLMVVCLLPTQFFGQNEVVCHLDMLSCLKIAFIHFLELSFDTPLSTTLPSTLNEKSVFMKLVYWLMVSIH